MSLPDIPDINPSIGIDKNQASNIILSSIGMEELSLSHILNAEAEKVQHFIKESAKNPDGNKINNIRKANESANSIVKDVLRNNMLLQMKLVDTKEYIYEQLQITVSARDDYVKIIENAAENAVVTFSEGTYALPEGLVLTKNITFNGAKNSDGDNTVEIEVEGNNTIEVKSKININDIRFVSKTNPGRAPITITADGSSLKMSGVTADVSVAQSTRAVSAGTFSSSYTFIQIVNVPGDDSSGSPANTDISIKDSHIVIEGDDSRFISYAGGTSGALYLDNVTAEYTGYGNSELSRGISVYQDTDSHLDITINNSKIWYLDYPLYIYAKEGTVDFSSYNCSFDGCEILVLKNVVNSNFYFSYCGLNGRNYYSETSYNYAIVVLDNCANTVVTLSNCSVFSTMSGSALQYIMLAKGDIEECTVNLFQDTIIVVEFPESIPEDYVAFYNVLPEYINFGEYVKFHPDNLRLFE